MATSQEIKAKMSELVRSRLSELRDKPHAELEALPIEKREECTIDDKRVQLVTFVEARELNQLLVVVQASRPTLMGISTQICVDAFLVSPNGEIVAPVPERELWDFT